MQTSRDRSTKFTSGARRSSTMLGLLLTALVLAVFGVTGPLAAQEEKKEVRVLVETAHGEHVKHRQIVCDGDDCDHQGAHVVFLDEEGNRSLLGGSGLSWVSAEEGDGNVFVMKKGGELAFGKRAVLGVQLTDLTDQLRATFGVPAGEGTMIAKVVEGSPAQRAGLRAGDVITGVNGQPVASSRGLASAVRDLREGATASLEVWRDGIVQTMEAQVEVRENRLHEANDFVRIKKREECSGDEDCGVVVEILGEDDHGVLGFDASTLCSGAEDCRVEVRCENGDCSCTVNGVGHDCSDIPGLPE